MMLNPLGETRKQRETLTKQALAEVIRQSIFRRRAYQTDVARWSGLSRSFLRSVLRAEKGISLFLFLELTRGLGADPCELLREVLNRRDALRGSMVGE
jgi:hypothetical protein